MTPEQRTNITDVTGNKILAVKNHRGNIALVGENNEIIMIIGRHAAFDKHGFFFNEDSILVLPKYEEN